MLIKPIKTFIITPITCLYYPFGSQFCPYIEHFAKSYQQTGWNIYQNQLQINSIIALNIQTHALNQWERLRDSVLYYKSIWTFTDTLQLFYGFKELTSLIKRPQSKQIKIIICIIVICASENGESIINVFEPCNYFLITPWCHKYSVINSL